MENEKHDHNGAIVLQGIYSKSEQTLLEAVYHTGGTDQPLEELVRELASGSFPVSTDKLWDVLVRNPRRWFTLYEGVEGKKVRLIPGTPFS